MYCMSKMLPQSVYVHEREWVKVNVFLVHKLNELLNILVQLFWLGLSLKCLCSCSFNSFRCCESSPAFMIICMSLFFFVVSAAQCLAIGLTSAKTNKHSEARLYCIPCVLCSQMVLMCTLTPLIIHSSWQHASCFTSCHAHQEQNLLLARCRRSNQACISFVPRWLVWSSQSWRMPAI